MLFNYMASPSVGPSRWLTPGTRARKKNSLVPVFFSEIGSFKNKTLES